MQASMGLFLFSVLLTTGASLQCDTCSAPGSSCTGMEMSCTSQQTCLTIVGEQTTGGQTSTHIWKSCYSQAACSVLKPGAIFETSGTSIKIQKVTCKAPPSSASLLLALSGLLMLKVLF
ncbi:phospholipase A2 inhibitor and Ly6/PLAUR domain-containing protein-like [Heteronotia binoei]|uniref:phospholipase A2 inhibitor and Ly6/PLAUR domain-containing protein-like n=1 Tax=Heteronotia binoei TaxID=13085 RepID=UPI00293056A0|nr:phospholipase A2 inhibitor and Ly6/PLAUR domain-containing protein-like [Heteronotia binoei]